MAASTTSEGVLVLTLDNPPVNALSQKVRQELAEALRRLEEEDELTGLAIAGAGGKFSAGADIREFGSPPQPPHLPDLCLGIEQASKPVAAAIEGLALGGGLEVALAADWRSAAPGAKLGLPEVALGLVPGAGGTQRLPRWVGVDAALPMVALGEPVSSGNAAEMGLIDEVSEDPVAAAIGLLGRGTRPRPARAAAAPAGASGDLAARIERRFAIEPARQEALRLVGLAAESDIQEGLAAEREAFVQLKQSEASEALRYAFRAERAATKPPAPAASTESKPVRSAVVVGAGAMGRNIAYALARAGIETAVQDRSEEALDAASAALRKQAKRDEEKRRLSEPQTKLLGRLSFVRSLPQGADLYLEAVFEDMQVKREVLAAAAEAGGEDALLATNTSYLDVNEIARSVPRPERVLGLHFFNPAHIMKLLEVVEGEKTSPETLAAGFTLAKRLKKLPVRAGVCRGFIGNRLFQAYQREAGLMVLEGARPDEVDSAVRAFGFPMGPFETVDLAGLQIGTAMRSAADPQSFDPRAFAVHDQLTAEGRTGRRSGEGFYRYGTDGQPTPSARVPELAAELRRTHRIDAQHWTPEEIAERCVLALAAEGQKVLAEGIAETPMHIDTVLLHGYGFPRARGGPMFYASRWGEEGLRTRIAALLERSSTRPADLTLPDRLTLDI